MNKFIRFSIFLILIVAALVLTLAIVEPNDVTVSRSIVIRASKETVYEQISKFKNWQNWSTLLQNDTSAKITYKGTDGLPGSTLEWAGDDGISGTGVIKNVSLEENLLHYTFTVSKPASMDADGILSVKDTGDYTKVTWTFHKHFPFIANAMLIVFDLDKYMGGDFERSLQKLRSYVETDVEPVIDIKEVEYAGGLIAGIRDTVNQDDISIFFGDTYSLFIKTPASKITGAPVGLFYEWDKVHSKTDVFAGFPVADTDIPVNGITFSQVTPSRAFKAIHKGDYTGLKKVHEALNKHLAQKGLTKWLTVEEYVVYNGTEKETSKWITNVYVLIQ
jgi:hypothetical protein